MTRPFHLRYVCKFCGAVVAEFRDVPSPEPNTLSVCDRPECRAQASAAWKAAA